MKQTIAFHNFTGGLSNDFKIAPPNSFLYARNIDIFEDANYVTLNPKTTKVSGSTVTDLVLWAVDGSPYDTNRYFYDLSGNIYKETSGGVWSNLRTVAGSAGQGLGILNNYVYYAGATTLGRYGPLSVTPGFVDNFLADGTTNLDQSQSRSGQTYTTPVAISEASTGKCPFNPVFDPVATISVMVQAKGTGNWTITLHDSDNNTLGTATLANAAVTGSALNSFTFSPQVRVVQGNTYHFHVTSTVADGTVQTGTTGDLSTATYNEYFGILIDTAYHPIMPLLNGIVIGNNNYLAFWNQAIYNPNQVELPTGYQARTIAWWNELVVVGAWKGDSQTNIEDAYLFFWDGISPTFNYSIQISNGLPNALNTLDNGLIGIYGQTGELFLDSAPFTLVHEVPLLAQNAALEVAPGAMSPFQAKMAIGYSLATTDTTGMHSGVYLWGNKTDQFPETLNFAYTLSTGHTQGTNLKIGMVKGIGNSLYIGWRDNTTYGVDKVAVSNGPFTDGELDLLLFDNGFPAKPKYADMLVIEFEPLQSGESITPQYAIDSNAFSQTYTPGSAVSVVGATQAVLPIGLRFNSISVGFVVGTATTFPRITAIYFSFNDLAEERDF